MSRVLQGNPMTPWYEAGFQPPNPMAAPTTQVRRNIRRPAQDSKYFAYRHRFLPLAASATDARDTIAIDGDADFDVIKLTSLFDNGGALVTFQLTPLSEAFNSFPAFISGLMGVNQWPLVAAPYPIRLPRSSQFTMVARDSQLIAADNNIIVAYHGAKRYRAPFLPARRYDVAKPFAYVLSFVIAALDGQGPIPANTTRTQTLRVDLDSDFEVRKLAIVTDTSIDFMMENGSDNWFQTPLRGSLLGASNIEAVAAGTPFAGQWPFILPAPRLITAGDYLRTEVFNRDAATASRVQIIVWGDRLYPAGGYMA